MTNIDLMLLQSQRECEQFKQIINSMNDSVIVVRDVIPEHLLTDLKQRKSYEKNEFRSRDPLRSDSEGMATQALFVNKKFFENVLNSKQNLDSTLKAQVFKPFGANS